MSARDEPIAKLARETAEDLYRDMHRYGSHPDVWPRKLEAYGQAVAALQAEQDARLADAAEMLWIVLANVSDGDWTKQRPEWQEAAARWRDNYFNALRAHSPLVQKET